MLVLVTGASGTLGRALLPRLQAAGHSVRVMSRRPPPPKPPAEWRQAALATGEGVPEAVAGAQAIIHAASDPRRAETTDVRGTALLLKEARRSGCAHFLYVSIVGVDRIPLPYYRHKLSGEETVRHGEVPWSILRATQFHTLIDMSLGVLAPWPVAVVPRGFRFQPIDPAEVGTRLVEMVEAGPSGLVPAIGGPEVHSIEDMVAAWLDARRRRRWIVRLPVPGEIARGYRAGLNTTPEGRYGRVTWRAWLARRYAP